LLIVDRGGNINGEVRERAAAGGTIEQAANSNVGLEPRLKKARFPPLVLSNPLL
jgi:hypothetical protein